MIVETAWDGVLPQPDWRRSRASSRHVAVHAGPAAKRFRRIFSTGSGALLEHNAVQGHDGKWARGHGLSDYGPRRSRTSIGSRGALRRAAGQKARCRFRDRVLKDYRQAKDAAQKVRRTGIACPTRARPALRRGKYGFPRDSTRLTNSGENATVLRVDDPRKNRIRAVKWATESIDPLSGRVFRLFWRSSRRFLILRGERKPPRSDKPGSTGGRGVMRAIVPPSMLTTAPRARRSAWDGSERHLRSPGLRRHALAFFKPLLHGPEKHGDPAVGRRSTKGVLRILEARVRARFKSDLPARAREPARDAP